MKKVLIVSQVITQTYYDLLIKSLHGCEVTLITGSEIQGDRIIKSPQHDPLSTKSRLKCWIKHYKFIMRWIHDNKGVKYDLVYATSNPPINSYIGIKLSKLFGCAFIYMNWDLYPQVIEGAINNPVARLICKMWRYWNKNNYPKIDCILTLGEGMAESIKEYMNKQVSVKVIPLGVDVDYLRPIKKNDNIFCVEHKIDNKFIVLYSGKMGRGHNIELILEAATCLEKYKDILFLFIGNGEKRKLVEDYIKSNKSDNVMLMDLQSDKIFPFSQASGDLCVVSQEKKMAKLFMPSKAYSALACGQGIIGICSNDDDLGKLINKYNVGKVVSNDKDREFADIVLFYYNNTVILNELGEQSRRVAEENFSLNNISYMYKDLFDSVLN